MLHRTFICLDFPDEVIKEIARVQEQLENWKFTGKMTELENLHLTLKFLGEIDNKAIMKAIEKLREINFREINCRLGHTGIFSSFGKPRIVWVKINGKELIKLQKQIDYNLAELFKPEERFMSHATIARVKYVADKKGFRDYVENIGVRTINFVVDRFKLKISELRPLGPLYTTIEEFLLKKN